MKFRSIIHQILEDTKVLNYYKDKEPIKDTDKIRVYHGFYSPADALVTLSYGLSGEMRAARIYSYESGNNPKGLFVSTDFNVVKKNFAGSGIIIEFDTRATNLEAPVWAGQDTYFVQGQYTKSFKDDEERNQETIRKREKYRQEDPEGDYHNNRISKSDRPELGDSLYGNYEKQALFIGNLNPNEIKSVWFNEGRYFRNKTNEPWTRYDRKSFLRKYGDILEKDSKGNEKIHRVSNKFFKPNDDFSMEKLKVITDAKGYDWKDVLDYLKRDDYIRSQLLWPKQIKQYKELSNSEPEDSVNENINLNLSKQIRQFQKKTSADKRLEDIFGVNVFRLYYDLNTGKQIQPTAKKPKLEMDVDIRNQLYDDIKSFLAKIDYTIQDFDNNRAINNKTNQVVKITKIISDYNQNIYNRYNLFLDAKSKRLDDNDKFYCVVSRHSHDIASMGSYYRFSSCEDLSDYTDISQTIFAGNEDNMFYDGEGVRPKQMIKNGDVIFYLIKHGDWNIKDPISRFASGVYCENTEAFWGSPTDKFKNFVRTWLPKFRTDALGDKKIDYKNDDTEKLKSLSGYMENETVVIGIIENNRFDVIKRFIEVGFNREKILKTILKLFGPKYYKNMLSKEMKDILDPVINEILEDINRKVSHLYTFIFEFEGSKIDRHLNDLLSKDIDGTVLKVLIDYYKGEGFVKWNEVYFDEDIRLICPIKPDSCNEFKPKWMKLMQHAGNDRNKLMSLLRDRNDSILARLKQKLEPE